jgi:hypothetical protein
MTFEGLVDRLQALFDVGQTRCVDVANERLGEMVTSSAALRAIITSIGPTVANQASYTLAANVANVLKCTINSVPFEGVASIEDLWDVVNGDADITGQVYVVEPDSDASMTTDSIRFYPVPTSSGLVISALVALRPAVLTYTTATALPIPVDAHPALLAGCEAILMDDEGRQDEAAKKGSEFAAGVRALEGGTVKRGKGSGRHRPRMVGYDVPLGS